MLASVFLRARSGIHLGVQWCFRGFAVVFRGVATVVLWFYCGFAVVMLWCCIGFAVVVLWFCIGFAHLRRGSHARRRIHARKRYSTYEAAAVEHAVAAVQHVVYHATSHASRQVDGFFVWEVGGACGRIRASVWSAWGGGRVRAFARGCGCLCLARRLARRRRARAAWHLPNEKNEVF